MLTINSNRWVPAILINQCDVCVRRVTKENQAGEGGVLGGKIPDSKENSLEKVKNKNLGRSKKKGGGLKNSHLCQIPRRRHS